MGMGRQRSSSRAGWPANLYPCKNGFKYRHPVSRKDAWMGTDRARAFEAARKLNALLIPSNDLVARVVARSETLADAIAIFRKDDMPSRRWGEKTALGYDQILRRIERERGTHECSAFSVRECAAYVREATESARGRQQLRLVLSWICACAVEEGWMETNPALQIRKAHFERKRDRLTKDAYEAIWEKAEPWLRNAMDLSLLTLLRREDVVSLRFADYHDDALWVVPSKTEGTTGKRLRIAADGALAEVLQRCRDGVLSPYVVHRLPEKARPRELRAKVRDHHTQVLPEQLSRAFAEARDRAEIAGGNPPTFHEVRSLGIALLREQGWKDEQIQQLAAHSDVAMTTHYLEGHEAPWTNVEAGQASLGSGKAK
ncbi:MAG: tyrosine-type recombinase/integrase [Dokdonella sp.]|uniref:tyrosine-type recombinase/integrase n=1 Tax=Dokdonella sp. TaxID=2291710 RepID=UPI003F7D3E66